MGKSSSITALADFKKMTDRGKFHFNFASKVQGSIYLTAAQVDALGIGDDAPDAELEVTITVKQ